MVTNSYLLMVLLARGRLFSVAVAQHINSGAESKKSPVCASRAGEKVDASRVSVLREILFLVVTQLNGTGNGIQGDLRHLSHRVPLLRSNAVNGIRNNESLYSDRLNTI